MRHVGFICLILSLACLVLAVFEVERLERALQIDRTPRWLEIHRAEMDEIAKHLRVYENSTGRYPTNDEQLLAVEDLVEFCRNAQWCDDYDLHFLRADGSGIITVWGEPFVYENRRGMPAKLFADSGVNRDKSAAYSLRVDDGIYIWSVAAEQAHRKLSYWQPRLMLIETAATAGCILFLVLYFVAIRRSIYRPWALRQPAWPVLESIALALAFLWLVSPRYGQQVDLCSVPASPQPELIAQYQSVIANYRGRGIIGQTVSEKIVQSRPNPQGM